MASPEKWVCRVETEARLDRKEAPVHWEPHRPGGQDGPDQDSPSGLGTESAGLGNQLG